jgi:hypothetical protein
MNRQQGLRAARAASQHGQIIILTVLILALGTGFLVYSMAGPRSIDYRKNAKTDAALAMAKEALIGRAVADSNHPGSLPCPDTNDDGIAEIFAGIACPSYIGRLPWKTLELPDLRDGDGERLWYMLSPAFRDNAAVEPLNTDTIGNITIYSGNNTTSLTNRAAAVIFAPGAPIGAQARSGTQSAACTVTGTTIAQSLCGTNYLETVSSINNANATGPYISAPATATFNDRLIVIDSVELMTAAETRAAKEILNALQAYKAGSMATTTSFCYPVGCYPWADISNGIANDGLNYGRVPLISADTGHANDWSDASPPVTIPQWLIDNQWGMVFFYTVAANRTYDHNPGSLTVDGTSGTDVVLISTGAATVARSGWPCSFAAGDARNYVDDSENCDNGTNFITPSDTTSKNRDRLYSLP